MKKIITLFLIIVTLFGISAFSACTQAPKTETTTTVSTTTKKEPDKFADSKYLGSWYNADSPEELLICTLNADGTAVFKNDSNATWEETKTGITITAKTDDKETTMEGYFIIAGDGFVARANEENQHYLDEGKGELQLEIMLTENTCVDCVKK